MMIIVSTLVISKRIYTEYLASKQIGRWLVFQLDGRWLVFQLDDIPSSLGLSFRLIGISC